MSYAALASLAQTINLILYRRRYSIYPDEKDQITAIHRSLVFLQAFLEKFPQKDNCLEERIRDIANKAEDIIEYFELEQLQSRFRLFKQAVGAKTLKFEHYPSGKSAHLCNDFHKLKTVREEIDSIVGEVTNIKNSFTVKDSQPIDFLTSSSSRLEPAPKDAMVGLEDDLMAIKDRLCGESSKLEVISIFGMGGIGKTTLARNAYDDPLTIHHFHVLCWITVSQDYSARNILLGLLASLNVFNVERSAESNESMVEKVYKSLKGRRYLIVMDDMWTTQAWDDVKRIFPDDNNGSRVILTTRLSDVASYPDSCSPFHQMSFMDADQSWNLLRQKVFADQDCPTELEDIGKKIAKGCRGLPLAIVVIGGVLSTVNMTRALWGEIAENVNFSVSAKYGTVEKILSLSYSHLPQHLRQCFLYMGCFPEDYEIPVSKLVTLWVAEGFFKPNESKSFEEGAEEYLAELVKRSLVFVDRRKFNGKIKSFRIHDLVRDLCIRKAHEERFQHRVSIALSGFNCLSNSYATVTRTIICIHACRSLIHSLGNFRLLRVLDVVNANFRSLPAQVFELFLLRYLALGQVTNIPAAISNLRNLQTLIVYSKFVRLPSEIWRMPQLRHIVSSSFDCLPHPRGAVFPMENLQTLSRVRNFRCAERMLEMIPNIKKLGIVYWADNYDGEYDLKNLVHLHQLEILKLEVRGSFPYGLDLKPVFFPKMLKRLTLRGCRLRWEDMTIVGSLPNLQVLKLIDWAFVGYKWETTEGQFQQLEFFLINGSDLEHWITESSHFPMLKCLMLHRCWCLSEIPYSIGEIPTLELIEVMYGKTSLVASAKWIQEEQESWGNDTLRIRYRHH